MTRSAFFAKRPKAALAALLSSCLMVTGLVVLVAGPSVLWGSKANAATRPSGLMFDSGMYDGNRPENATAFAQKRGAPLDVLTVFPTRDSWNELLNTWWLDVAPAGFQGTMSTGIPLWPNDGNASAAAGGSYDGYYRQMAQQLKDNGYADAYVRLSWEFNLKDWKSAATPSNKDQWIAAFRRASNVFKSVSSDFRIVFNPNAGRGDTGLAPEQAYPGDQYVDVVAIDAYDWYPAYTSEAAWTEHKTGAYGWDYWMNFAKSHGKKFALPEWGVYTGSSASGGDNPKYIDYVYNYLKANAADVAYEAYFDEDMSYCTCSLRQNPKAEAAYVAWMPKLKGSGQPTQPTTPPTSQPTTSPTTTPTQPTTPPTSQPTTPPTSQPTAPGTGQATATVVGSDKVTVSWTASTSPSSWSVGRDGSDSDGTGPWTGTAPGSAREWTFDKLLPGTTYTFTISGGGQTFTAKATMPGGDGATQTPTTDPTTPPTSDPTTPPTSDPTTPPTSDPTTPPTSDPTTPPTSDPTTPPTSDPTPGRATAKAISAHQVKVSWSASASPSSWTVARDGSDSQGTGPWQGIAPGDAREWVFNYLVPGKTYTFTISAGGQTYTASLTMPQGSTTPPTGGKALTAVQIGPNQVLVAWEARHSPRKWTVARDGYDIDGTGAWSTRIGGWKRYFVFDRLQPSTAYTFTVTGGGRTYSAVLTTHG